MEKRSQHHLFAIVFLVVALFHLTRAMAQLELVVAGYDIPIWLSVLAGIFAGWLSYLGFREW